MSESDQLTAFDLLDAWPATEDAVGVRHFVPRVDAEPDAIRRELSQMANTDAVVRVGADRYDLTAIGAIVASAPDGGQSLALDMERENE